MCSTTDPRLALIGTAIDELARRPGEQQRPAATGTWTRWPSAWRASGRWSPTSTPAWPSGCRVHRADRACRRRQRGRPAGRATARRRRHGTQARSAADRPSRGPPVRSPATSTSSVAVTSGCSRTVTWCAPTVRIGVAISIRRRSSSGPPAARTASAMSDALTEPNSRPWRAGPDPAAGRSSAGQPLGGLLGVVQAADVPGRAGPLDQLDLLLGAAGPAHGQAARDEVVAAVAAGHLDHVTGLAQAGDLVGEDQLHRCATHRFRPSRLSVPCWCTAAAPSRGRS